MGASRKLQGEIDRVLKKVQEGVDVFDSIWNKVYDTDNANQKEKFEADLKKEIKKLQRYRDQIKTWIQSSEIKDKKVSASYEQALMDARKLIEREMERFKICEKETKTKAFSKEGLGQQPKTYLKEKAKSETRDWLNNVVGELENQIDSFEAEIEGLSVKKGKTRPPRLTHLETSITRHKAHIMKLELILRLLDNDELSPEQVNDVKDFLDDYAERNQEDFDEFSDVDELYSSLPLDKVESLEDLVTMGPPGLVKGVSSSSAVLSTKHHLAAPAAQASGLSFGSMPALSVSRDYKSAALSIHQRVEESLQTQQRVVKIQPAFRDSSDCNSAALSIQKKYRGWKCRKEFLQIRQKVVKIQAHVRGYQVRKMYEAFSAVDIPEESGIRRHRGGVGLRVFQHETKPISEIGEEEVQKLFYELRRKRARNKAAKRLISVLKNIQPLQVNLEEYGEAKVPSSSLFFSPFSTPSSTTWTSTQEKLLERNLQLCCEDCPERWEKVASVVGGGKSAEDVKNHWKAPASENKISYSKQALRKPILPPIRAGNRRAVIPDILSSLAGVMTFLDYKEENIKEKTKARESEYVSAIQTEIEDKRTYDMKGKKESTEIAPCTDFEFENLPEYIRRCVTYCTLFPLGHEFDKDTLVQLWIAEGLVDAKAKEKMENQGSACFDILVYKEYIVPSIFDKLYKQPKYKINEAKASLWYFPQGLSKDTYVRIEDGKLEHTTKTTLHLSLQKLDSTDFEALKKCKQLRTLLYLGECGSSIKDLPHDLPLCLKSLRTLVLSRTVISGLPISVGCLEALHYLDLSYTPVRVLPRSIGSLYSLQTLKLRDCFALNALPQEMRKLKNLRHLDFDIVRQLNSMPKGMGRLTNLQTLKAFLVGQEDGCRITELKNMDDLAGSFSILRLENVVNVIEAKNAGLSNKQYIKKLELRWGEVRNQNSADEEILEYLRPHPNLEELQLLFYSGSVLPSWICDPSFNKFVSITLWNCKNCYLLPSVGELPTLRFLKIVGMSSVKDINSLFYRNYGSQGLKAFPKLEKLKLENMLNLEEWTGMENGDFPSLLQMFIIYCPKLYDLPLLSHLKALKNLEISCCPSLQSLPGEPQLPASLELLVIRECPKVKERCHKDGGEDWRKIAHVPSIWIDEEEISLN